MSVRVISLVVLPLAFLDHTPFAILVLQLCDLNYCTYPQSPEPNHVQEHRLRIPLTSAWKALLQMRKSSQAQVSTPVGADLFSTRYNLVASAVSAMKRRTNLKLIPHNFINITEQQSVIVHYQFSCFDMCTMCFNVGYPQRRIKQREKSYHHQKMPQKTQKCRKAMTIVVTPLTWPSTEACPSMEAFPSPRRITLVMLSETPIPQMQALPLEWVIP